MPVAAPGPVVVGGIAIALLLAGAPDDGALRKELDACAARIEELKARHARGEAAGRELERLLIRAQELATELERTRAEPPPAPLAPSPEELRERADAARDAADRLTAEIAELDVKIGDARRLLGAESDATLARAALGSGRSNVEIEERLRVLQARRAELAGRRALVEAAAARLEAEAQAADDR